MVSSGNWFDVDCTHRPAQYSIIQAYLNQRAKILRNNSNLRKNPRKDMFFYLCNSCQTHLPSIAMPLGRIKWFLILLPFLFNLPMMSFSFIQEHKEYKKRNFPLVKEIVIHANWQKRSKDFLKNSKTAWLSNNSKGVASTSDSCPLISEYRSSMPVLNAFISELCMNYKWFLIAK